MDKSRKVILASCVCASFLAGIFACSVEDTNLEKKGLFVCKTQPGCMGSDGLCTTDTTKCKDPEAKCAATADDSCLAGSVCIAIDPDNQEGRCVLIDQVEHCHDNDHDMYYGADPGFDDTCGFTDAMPKDCNDGDSSINPKATEFCNGVDDTCDGCVDSICPSNCGDNKNQKCDCFTDPGLCKPLVDLCIGAGAAEDMVHVPGAVCSPKIAGVMFCDSKTFAEYGGPVYAYCKDDACNTSDSYTIDKSKSCPELDSSKAVVNFPGADGKEYVYAFDERAYSTEDDSICDKLDNDCNGVIDCTGEDCGCKTECSTAGYAVKECYATTDAVYIKLDSSKLEYHQSIMNDLKSHGHADCVGEVKCTETYGQPKCVNSSNKEINKSSSCTPDK